MLSIGPPAVSPKNGFRSSSRVFPVFFSDPHHDAVPKLSRLAKRHGIHEGVITNDGMPRIYIPSATKAKRFVRMENPKKVSEKAVFESSLRWWRWRFRHV